MWRKTKEPGISLNVLGKAVNFLLEIEKTVIFLNDQHFKWHVGMESFSSHHYNCAFFVVFVPIIIRINLDYVAEALSWVGKRSERPVTTPEDLLNIILLSSTVLWQYRRERGGRAPDIGQETTLADIGWDIQYLLIPKQ